MKRMRTNFLSEWFNSLTRKPLVIRGARQVGKTWLVRHFARMENLELIELNFEKQPELESLFQINDPKDILLNLRTLTKGDIDPKKSLLFLDEIQAAPELLAKLRWFAEDMPDLPVIAAGSLLEFTLSEYEFSMPVGRINYMHLEPFSFEEFLDALEETGLKEYIEQFELTQNIPEAVHIQLMKLLNEYIIVGGMPAAILTWGNTRSLDKVSQVHFDLLATYRDDFNKYRGRLDINRLDDVMQAVPKQLGNKLVYTKINSEITSVSLKQGFDLLTKARVCHRIVSTAANGVPLGAEINKKYVKALLLDCGLCSASLGLTLHQLQSIQELTLINSGGIAEQYVGQILRAIHPAFVQPMLYYWQRTEKASNAEIDYIFQHQNQVIPIEVKAGATGSLKSLHRFMKEKKKRLAIRINSDYPSVVKVNVKDSTGTPVEYELLSLPFYLLGQLNRLVSCISGTNTG